MSDVQRSSDERPPCMCGHVASTHDMGYGLATCIVGDCDCEWYVADEREESAEQLPMTDTSKPAALSSKECLYYRMVRAAWACSACDGQGHNFVPGACKVCKVCESLRDALLSERGAFMSLHSEPGTKVRYHWGLAGYDGDVRAAREKLTLGAIYTVKALNVYDSASSVEFREVDGLFNPVQFAPADTSETGVSRVAQLETALGQWLHDFGSTNELSQRTRILLGIPHPPPVKAGEQPHKNPADFPGGPLEYPEDFDDTSY